MFSVIFDMDGTLLDTQRICIPAWDFAGEKQGLKNAGEHIPFVCGMNEVGWTKYIVDNFIGIDVDAFKKDMRDYIIENGKVTFKKGARKLLTFLKENGIKVGIASGSSTASITHHLKEVGALTEFDALVGGKDVENGKPEPDIFLLTAKKLGVNPSDCFVFEDSENGIIAGVRAGMKCIGVPDIKAFPDEVKALMFCHLNSLDEAIPIFQKLLADN